MESLVMKFFIIIMTLNSFVNGRFIQKVEDHTMETSEIVKICVKGCEMKFRLNAEKPNWDYLMCSDYCSLLFLNRKKKVITTLICTDEVCVSNDKILVFFSYFRSLAIPIRSSINHLSFCFLQLQFSGCKFACNYYRYLLAAVHQTEFFH